MPSESQKRTPNRNLNDMIQLAFLTFLQDLIQQQQVSDFDTLYARFEDRFPDTVEDADPAVIRRIIQQSEDVLRGIYNQHVN